jgi:hypothetical protein
MTWLRCDFDPLDVFVQSDARSLDIGSYGHHGEISPAAFAGALRTAILRKAGYVFPSRGRSPLPSQTNLAKRAAHIVGIGREVGFDFHFAGPILRDENNVLLFASPRDQLTTVPERPCDPIWSKPPRTLDATVLSDITRGSGTNGSDAALPTLLRGPAKTKPDEHLVTLSQLCFALGERVKNEPDLQSAHSSFESHLGDRRQVDLQEVARSERRHGHTREASGVTAEGKLFSRDTQRFADAATGATLRTGGYAGFVRGVNANDLPNAELLRVGGDGHLAQLRVQPLADDPDYQLVKALADLAREAIAQRGRFSLYLATPAIFAGGWRPSLTGINGVGVTLVAAAVGRPQIVAGWDLAQHAPKPVRRAVPAGSMYFYEIAPDRNASESAETIVQTAKTIVQKHHFAESISCEGQNLGFGYTFVGVW